MVRTPFSVTRWSTVLRAVAAVAMFAAAVGCASDQQIRTLRPGVLTVAVISDAPTSPYDPQLWIRRYVERFTSNTS